MNRDVYEAWLNMSETKEVFKCLNDNIKTVEENIVDGNCLQNSAESTACQYAYDVGLLEGLKCFKKSLLNYLDK